MPELIKDLFVAIGGGSVVLVGILTIFKSFFLKLFETGIEASFEKNLEKYKNQLSRTTKAYEILLEREMRFYERMEPIFAELVPLAHDLLYYMKNNENVERKSACESFRNCFGRYTELIKELKNETLIHQSYIPKSVFNTSTAVTNQMENTFDYWFEMAKLLFAGKYEEIDYKKGEEINDTLFLCLAATEMEIKKRLEELSGI